MVSYVKMRHFRHYCGQLFTNQTKFPHMCKTQLLHHSLQLTWGSLCVFKSFCFDYISALFQVRRMASGRAACPTSVERSSSRPSTTCWSAASWTVALFASASGLLSHTRRRRRPLIKGMSCSLTADNKVKRHAINCQIKARTRLMVRLQLIAGVCSVWISGNYLYLYLLYQYVHIVLLYSATCCSGFLFITEIAFSLTHSVLNDSPFFSVKLLLMNHNTSCRCFTIKIFPVKKEEIMLKDFNTKMLTFHLRHKGPAYKHLEAQKKQHKCWR